MGVLLPGVIGTLVDVGGGYGAFITDILAGAITGGA